MKKLIILSGKKQVGKTTVTEYLSEYYNFHPFALADDLKQDLQEFLYTFRLDVPLDYFYDNNKKNNKRIEVYAGNEKPTIRQLLQYYGEFIKQCFGQSYWINRVCNDIRMTNKKLVVVSDARFNYEIEGIIKQLRKYYEIFTIQIKRYTGLIDSHTSEKGVEYGFDFYIDNNDTLEELKIKIDKICECIKIE